MHQTGLEVITQKSMHVSKRTNQITRDSPPMATLGHAYMQKYHKHDSTFSFAQRLCSPRNT
jgi:hypothetical protein